MLEQLTQAPLQFVLKGAMGLLIACVLYVIAEAAARPPRRRVH